MKNILIAFCILFAITTNAQFKQANLQASGLTCSMCSKAIFKALSVVPFVDKVDSDIKNSSYIISFKNGMDIDFDALKTAVTGAGFSVAQLKVTANFDDVKVKNDAHIIIDGKTLHFLNVSNQTLNGSKTFTIVDKNFAAAKDLKKYAQFTNMKCYQTGVMENCCTKKDGSVGTRVYHVTI
jgi:copper chaperone CopZ